MQVTVSYCSFWVWNSVIISWFSRTSSLCVLSRGPERRVTAEQPSTRWTVSEDRGGFVGAADWWGLFRGEQSENWETLTQRGKRRGERVKAGNGFSNLNGISCYIKDVHSERGTSGSRREKKDRWAPLCLYLGTLLWGKIQQRPLVVAK